MFTLIQTTTLSTQTAIINLTSIPQTYKDLMIVFNGKGTATADWDRLYIARNNNNTNYAEVGSYANASNSGAFLGSDTSWWQVNNYMASSFSNANQFSSGWYYMPNYTSASYGQTIIGLSPSQYYANNASGVRMGVTAGLHTTLAATTSLKFLGIGDLYAPTTISLYGIS